MAHDGPNETLSRSLRARARAMAARYGANRATSIIVLDYGLYSLTNFVAAVAVARHSTLALFGIYGLLFQFTNFILVMARALLGETLLIAGEEDERARVGAVSLAFVVGAALAPIVWLIAAPFVSQGTGARLALAMIVALPALLAQDMLRFIAFASSKAGTAVRSDCAWLAVLLGYVVAASIGVVPFGAVWAAGAWSAGAYAGLVFVGGLRLIRPHRTLDGVRWWVRQRKTSRALAVETVGAAMVGPGAAVGVAAVASEAVVGGLRGASTLFNPVLVLAQAVRTARTGRTEARSADHDRGARVFLSVAALAWGGLLVWVPGLGSLILGKVWGSAVRSIVLLEALARVGIGSVQVDSARLRSQGQTGRAAALGFATGCAVVGAVTAGAVIGGLVGAACGSAIAYLVAAAFWMRRGAGVTKEADRHGLAQGPAQASSLG